MNSGSSNQKVINKKITKEVNQYSTCSIDPGNITFATIYNPEGNCQKLFTRSNTTRLSNLLKKKLSMLKYDRNKKSILIRVSLLWEKESEMIHSILNLLINILSVLYLYQKKHILNFSSINVQKFI